MLTVKIYDIGGNDGLRSRLAYPLADITVLDKKTGFDVEQQEIPRGYYPADILLANHLIEHLWDPDSFLDKCYRAMGNETILEISTPNLAAWFNRALFVFGYLPHSYEVSHTHNVGKISAWNKEKVGGHIRLFTPYALTQLLKKHALKVIDVQGEYSTYPCNLVIKVIDRVLTLNPNLASAFRIKARKI